MQNQSRYQLDQDNKTYILSTSLFNDKLQLICESNSQKFSAEYNIYDLYKLSNYFNSTKSVAQVQKYVNGIIEKQRVGIFEEGNILRLVLYLINNDKIIIPLNKTISQVNLNNNYDYEKLIFQNQQNNIIIPTTTTNYTEQNYLSDQQLLEKLGLYPPNANYYLNNLNINSQPYYIENNNAGITSIPYTQIDSPGNITINKTITNPINTTSNVVINSNKNNIITTTYPQSDASANNYNFKQNEINIGQIEEDNQTQLLEQEKIKKEMKRVLDESLKLRKQNESLQTENSALSNENNILKKENEKIRTELINQQNEIKTYKEENEKYKNQFLLFQNSSQAYKEQNGELIKIKEEYENQNKILKNNLEQINKEKELLNKEIEELKHNLTIVSNENESLRNNINDLKVNLEKQQPSISEEEIKKLIEENSIFRIKAQENDLLKKQIEDLQYQIQIGQEKEEDYEEEQEVKGDIIHDMKELELITQKINTDNKKIIINLLYKASADGDKASVFHEKCDQAKNTIVLVETKDGMRFGGFTTCSWSGNCIDKNDPNAFIFSFDKMKTYDNIPGDEAIGCYPKFGPIFLGCQIKIFDNAFTKGGTTYEKELNYNTQEDYELTGGKRNFDVKDIEVYEVIIE